MTHSDQRIFVHEREDWDAKERPLDHSLHACNRHGVEEDHVKTFDPSQLDASYSYAI